MYHWRYKLPVVFFLIYGRDFEGEVQTKTTNRGEARAAVKKKLNAKYTQKMDTFPANGTLEVWARLVTRHNQEWCARPDNPRIPKRWAKQLAYSLAKS